MLELSAATKLLRSLQQVERILADHGIGLCSVGRWTDVSEPRCVITDVRQHTPLLVLQVAKGDLFCEHGSIQLVLLQRSGNEQ